jgi:hypothetical protein
MFYSSFHDVQIRFTNVNSNYTAVTTLERDKSKICLPNQGVYVVQPISCQKFDKESFTYNTNDPQQLNLVPQEFLVKGEITIQKLLTSKIKLSLEEFVVIQIVEKLEEE